MIRFDSDYMEGAHPEVLDALVQTNSYSAGGYGEDEFCEKARNIIKNKFFTGDAGIHFIPGGTLTNIVVAACALRPHHCILSAKSGHINVHETGAIEATGHKIISLGSVDGKITAKQIEKAVFDHENDEAREHTVKPQMVYISNPTELGTLYKKSELQDISDVCRKHGLIFYIDGARIGYALESSENDIDISYFSGCCDAFYIGGTKAGALFGEALVVNNPDMNKDFRYILKQRGGLLAKGRLMGVQFFELFRNDLYFRIAGHANKCSSMLKKSLEDKGYDFISDSYTNQQFPVMPDEHINKLRDKYSFSYWAKISDKNSCIRFCTGWATRPDDVEKLCRDIYGL